MLKAVAAEVHARRLKGRWGNRTMETIKGMDDAVVARIGVSEWNQASSKQRWWLLAYKYLPRKIRVPVARIDLSNVKMEFEDAGALGSALQERSSSSNIESLIIGNDVVLQLKGKLDSDFFDASGQGMDPSYCVILAWWLTTPFTGSIAEVVLDGCPPPKPVAARRSTQEKISRVV